MFILQTFRVVTLMSLLCVFANPSRSQAVQDSVLAHPEADRIFTEAVRQFRAGRYERAAGSFTLILEQYKESHRYTAACVMAAKAYYQLGEYQTAIRLLSDFLNERPHTVYLDDAHYTLGLNYYQAGLYKEAATELLTVWQTSEEAKLREQAEQLLRAIAFNDLSVAELRTVLGSTTHDAPNVLLSVWLAEKVFATGDVNGAKELLRDIVTLPKGGRGVAQAEELLKRIEQSGVLSIGVVLPLMRKSGESSAPDIGSELLDGIRLATDEYNKEAVPKVNLNIRDTERDVGVAARQVSELCFDSQTAAIIGPLFSNEVFASAGIANARGVPLLTPTATSDGLAAIGEYIFQANPDYSNRARAVAQYAFLKQHAKRFAVLSPTDTSGKTMTGAFVDEVTKLGGEIVDVQWYEPGETDLRLQLTELRSRGLEKAEMYVVNFTSRLRPLEFKKMLQWGVPQRMLDSLMERNASAPVELLFGENGRHIADSLKLTVQHLRSRHDSLGLSVKTLDAIFLPISSSEEIGIVTSQLRYFNFQTQLLGTGNWYDAGELDQNRQYANGVIFTTDAYWNEEEPAYQDFVHRFHDAFNKRPTRNTLFGYDAMKLLLRVIRQGATHRDEIASALSRVRNFEGIHSKISLGESRINSFLTILQFKNRSLNKIGEIDVERKEIVTVE